MMRQALVAIVMAGLIGLASCGSDGGDIKFKCQNGVGVYWSDSSGDVSTVKDDPSCPEEGY